MNNRGVVIIFSLLAVTLISGFLAVLFLRSISDARLTARQTDDISTFWLAEAGIARIKNQLGVPVAVSGTLANPSDATRIYRYTVPTPSPMAVSGYYTLDSIGTIQTTASVLKASRTLSVTLKVTPADPSAFDFALATPSTDITYKTAGISKPGDEANAVKLDSKLTFQDLFGIPMATMNALGTTPDFSGSLSGINWVNVPTGDTLVVSNLNGSGILFVNGDFKITGGGNFGGIIYVIGSLQSLGTAQINGSVFVASSEAMKKVIWGTSNLIFNQNNINNAFSQLSLHSIVSWKDN